MVTLCKRGLHELAGSNLLARKSDGRSRCRACYNAYQRRWYATKRSQRFLKPGQHNSTNMPISRSLCRAGVHAMREDNILIDPSTGARRCRKCRNESRRHRPATKVRCLVAGCEGATTRSPRNAETTYLCREHREHPPSWLQRSGLRIEGTRLVAA